MGGNDGYAAVLLAGGAARRLAGAAKPALPVAGVPMLHRVLAAVDGATARIVVGPPGLPVPPGVARTQEEPPGAGPVAAAAAGLALLPPGVPWVALLAADLPLLTVPAVTTLRAAATAGDGAVFIDDSGRRQWLCGVWRTPSLSSVVTGAPPDAALRRVLGALDVRDVSTTADPPPWYDCDTDADLRRVEEWTR